MGNEKVGVKSLNNIFVLLAQIGSHEEFRDFIEQLGLPDLIAQNIQNKLTSLSRELREDINNENEYLDWEIEEIPQLAGDYIRRWLAGRLSYTIQALTTEALHFATGEPISVSQLRALYDDVVTPVDTTRRTDLPIKGRGGNKPKKFEWTNERLIEYKRLVDDLRLLWNSIVDFYDANNHQIECLFKVRELEIYKRYKQKYKKIPEGLLQKVLRRKQKKGRQYWPLFFALEHARREMGIDYQYSADTLHKFYKEGVKLLGPID